MRRCLVFALLWGAAFTVRVRAAGELPPLLEAAATVDWGPDRGQNLGTLFEIRDREGRVIAGAGFMGVYNTQPRGERGLLQVFARVPGQATPWHVERLPRVPGTATGYYPFSLDGQLYVHDRGGGDPKTPRVHRWNATSSEWEGAPEIVPYAEHVAGKLLTVVGDEVRYEGSPVFSAATHARLGEHYFGSGHFFVKEAAPTVSPPINRLVVGSWQPELGAAIERRENCTLELPIKNEFIYTFGQWRERVLVVSNNGRVASFDGSQWTTHREPVVGLSYQVYAGLNFRDELLLGQYPSGEIFSYDGTQLTQRAGWPPVLQGVSRSAREAQTLALYGGELYAGVWPWGEVWRLEADSDNWAFVQRFFSHPLPTAQTTHPYEAETKAVDAVANLWGQRITGLLPHGESLIVTTSSKTGAAWNAKFAFLHEPESKNKKNGSSLAEYGAIYRVTAPGNLAVSTHWSERPTTFEVTVVPGALRVSQHSSACDVNSTVSLPAHLTENFRPATIKWGQGRFGPTTGKITPTREVLSAGTRPAPWRAVYLHLNRLVPRDADEDTARQLVDAAVERAHQEGLGAILPYANDSRGRVSYPSAIVGERTFGEIDVLSMVVGACRARGMAVYPVVCMTVSGGESPAGILTAHPEWALRHEDGTPLGYISPAHADARRWMAELVREVAVRHRPDGVILDYIRFHNRPLLLDPQSQAAFEASLPDGIPDDERARRFQQAKEEAVTRLVEAVDGAVRPAVSEIVIGAYCWGAHTLANHLTAQVWDRWVEAGLIDLVNVSGYVYHSQFGDAFLDTFEQRMQAAYDANRRLSRQATLTFALGLVTSHGSVRSVADILGYLDRADRVGLGGFAMFSWDSLVPWLDELELPSP